MRMTKVHSVPILFSDRCFQAILLQVGNPIVQVNLNKVPKYSLVFTFSLQSMHGANFPKTIFSVVFSSCLTPPQNLICRSWNISKRVYLLVSSLECKTIAWKEFHLWCYKVKRDGCVDSTWLPNDRRLCRQLWWQLRWQVYCTTCWSPHNSAQFSIPLVPTTSQQFCRQEQSISGTHECRNHNTHVKTWCIIRQQAWSKKK